jgi:CDP-diacylglycerol--glycerol-3-phosphate 3-phosphatidyltransferase
LSPGFAISPDKIHILQTPTEFYSSLKAKILRAKRSVYLSTLYIGLKEVELVSKCTDCLSIASNSTKIETIRLALRKNPDLKISILSDALRGTRETPESSSASLLAPLISEFGEDRVQIRMYHTPNLTGLRKAVVPRVIDEGWGVQHVKLYGFDDEVMLSG